AITEEVTTTTTTPRIPRRRSLSTSTELSDSTRDRLRQAAEGKRRAPFEFEDASQYVPRPSVTPPNTRDPSLYGTGDSLSSFTLASDDSTFTGLPSSLVQGGGSFGAYAQVPPSRRVDPVISHPTSIPGASTFDNTQHIYLGNASRGNASRDLENPGRIPAREDRAAREASLGISLGPSAQSAADATPHQRLMEGLLRALSPADLAYIASFVPGANESAAGIAGVASAPLPPASFSGQ
ncbi:hypothetical protein JCM10908_000751, partial [Rhodotorula pacifica]|uniref:uncharacterized protein n=1 Tax=Rhodotorula pacifica TaxID=1495444 RepID=UPI00317D6CD5